MTYVLQRRLGRGGMGVVDLATAPDGRPVAVKRLGLSGSIDEMASVRQRLRREAAAMATVRHAHVVPLLEVLDDGDDVVLVMPYLAGGSLADRVARSGPLPEGEVRALAVALLGALAAAHRGGVVHRDIKPANVLFDGAGAAFLADFGVASLRDATPGLTMTGRLVGTPEFMAPEQARGSRPDPASDVFSLGATLAFAATGEPPYGRADPLVTVHRAARGRVQTLPAHLPSDLRRLLRPMLDRQPRRRPTAAAALARWAAGGRRGAPAAAGPAGTVVAAPPARRRRLVVGAALGAAVGACATTAAGMALSATSADPATAAVETTTTTTTAPEPPCQDQPYRPCGHDAAPFTDGVRCTDDHADYDADPGNGCEATPDTLDGSSLGSRLEGANLVPATDVDRYTFTVVDNFSFTCDGEVRVTLTPPPGMRMRLDLLQDQRIVKTVTTGSGRAATARLEEPRCASDDAGELVAQVSWAGDTRSAAPYRLERSGDF